LDALAFAIQRKQVNYILDADIKGFFDNLSKSWLVKFVEHRVADRRILRLIKVSRRALGSTTTQDCPGTRGVVPAHVAFRVSPKASAS
jgi:retron-type reverse transcriptase